MPRDLADVLHHFLPELEEGVPADPESGPLHDPLSAREGMAPTDFAADRIPHERPPPPLPILGLPIGGHDVVRAALAWNLAIETTRLGGTSVILSPDADHGSPLWPKAGVGPLGCELLFCPAPDLASLYAAAADLAAARAEKARRGGIVFVRIPPAWLIAPGAPANVIAWVLLLSSSKHHDLSEAFDLASEITKAHPNVEIGLTVHAANTIAEARSAFESLARMSEEKLGLVLTSYGLLVDDLHVYRAIAAQRPIGLVHPQAPASRALMDVARLLYEDARSRLLG
ncbi:MAG: hypothetical protein CL933_13015 [Deltaproteobacteria bacterium]|nr:hypothetical protein [Deltaproteobacteria bacterium]